MKSRVIVVPLIKNREGRLLLCRMPADRGVYPGEWGLPGGGIEPGETMGEALVREVREELGLELERFTPLLFKDTVHRKRYADGSSEEIYMIFLLFDCLAGDGEVRLNAELAEHAWVLPDELERYALNEATVDTFRRLGILSEGAAADA